LASIVFKTLSGEAEEAMEERSAKQMIMANLDVLDDATEAVLIVAHSDGSISNHHTTDVLHVQLGLVRTTELQLEEKVRNAERIPYAEDAEMVQ
jgi:hypothetical protein